MIFMRGSGLSTSTQFICFHKKTEQFYDFQAQNVFMSYALLTSLVPVNVNYYG